MSSTRNSSAGTEERLLSPQVNSYDEDDLEGTPNYHHRRSHSVLWTWWSVVQGAGFVSAGAIVALITTLIVSTSVPSEELTESITEGVVIDGGQSFRMWAPSAACGDTPEKAVAAGCIYDDVLLHWMPPACSSPELIDEFEHVWPWEFFEDNNATKPISLARVRKGTHDIKWVSMDLHRWHCVATWKILSSGARWGTKVPGYALNWNHSVHCADHVLINMHTDDPFTINSHLDIEYTPCVSIAKDKTFAMAKTW